MKATNQELIDSYEETQSVWKTAEVFGMCGQSVHERLVKTGKINKMRIFTDTDKEFLRKNYKKYITTGTLEYLAKELKRTKQYICRQARAMGLTGKLTKHIWVETHGQSGHSFYPIWNSMMLRCYNKKHSEYKNYGARGITVCAEWKHSPGIFIKWLISNNYKKGLTIDRENNDGLYCPQNCRIATYKTQMQNKRNNIYVYLNGEKIVLSELARMNNLKGSTVYRRHKRGERGYHMLSRPVYAAENKKRI